MIDHIQHTWGTVSVKTTGLHHIELQMRVNGKPNDQIFFPLNDIQAEALQNALGRHRGALQA